MTLNSQDNAGEGPQKIAAVSAKADGRQLSDDHSLTANQSKITPADIKDSLYAEGLPEGIEFVAPEDSQMNAENGYNNDDYIELKLQDPHDLCALTLTMERINHFTRAAMQDDAKLFHIFGENHLMSAHILAQACYAATIPGCVSGHERPVNDLATSAKDEYSIDLSDLSLDDLQQADPSGHLYARTVGADNPFPAPLAKNQRIAAILRGGGMWANIDAMKKDNDDYIDERDPLLKEMAKEVFPDQNLNLNHIPTDPHTKERDPRGSILRNFMMTRRAFDAASSHNTRDMVIGTGRNHLGRKIDNIDYRHALPAALLRESAKRAQDHTHVISLLPASHRDGYYPEQITPPGLDGGHIPVIVHGLSEVTHYDCEDYPANYLERLADSFHRAGQQQHPALQAALMPYAPEPFEKIREELRALEQSL